jgi:predicted enzyme related to lactoylglutathione lyase
MTVQEWASGAGALISGGAFEIGGSTVQPKMPVMDLGCAAYFKDSEDNVMGLWQNAT